MTVLLHVSDTHFGTEVPAVVAALQRLSERLDPDLLVVSGDVTQRARHHQFDAARRALGALRARRRLLLPGNHDIPLFNLVQRLFDPYRGWRRAFGAELAPRIEDADLMVLGVRSTRRWRHIDGEVSRRQVEAVAQRLHRATPQQLRIVVTHHPVQVPRAEERHNLLRGHREAIRRWSEAGADLILGGHIHLPFVQALRETRRGLPRAVWAVQAGTAVSSRLRGAAGNSVNLIRSADSSQPRRCSVERWDYDPAAGHFALAARDDLVCDDARR